MPPKEYDLKGITLGFGGRAATLVANAIVKGGFERDVGIRLLAFGFVYFRWSNIGSRPQTL
jgi:hypothetical protein